MKVCLMARITCAMQRKDDKVRKLNSLRTRTIWCLCLLGVLTYCSAVASANTEYYRHIIFDNSLTPDAYFYSAADANGASFVEQSNSRLPVETKTFMTPPNALRL